MLAGSLANNGMLDEAVAQLRKTTELFPDNSTSRESLAEHLWRQGKLAEALRSELEGQRLAGMPPEWLEKMRKAADEGGWIGLQRTFAEYGEEQRRKTGHFSALALAQAYSFLGDRNKAIEELRRGYGDRDADLVYMKQAIALQSLKDDPGFREIARKIGLPE